VHAQDISKSMILLAEKRSDASVMFSISNALELPYATGYFDSVFHFGGINLFGDLRRAINEMARVCKIGGRVVFGDEGIAPHLRGTKYAEIAIANNKLWEADTPMGLLPHSANNIVLNYVLGNCFYVISFDNGAGFPFMNIDIEHKGLRVAAQEPVSLARLKGLRRKRNRILLKGRNPPECRCMIYWRKLLMKPFDLNSKAYCHQWKPNLNFFRQGFQALHGGAAETQIVSDTRGFCKPSLRGRCE